MLHETYDGPTAQSTSPPGLRQGVLQDPGPPWVESVTVGYVAAGPPSLTVVPVSDDRIDDAALQFLPHFLCSVPEEYWFYWISWRCLQRCFCTPRSAWSDGGYTHMRRSTGHLEDFCGISMAPCIWQSLCSMLSVPEEYSYAVFLGDHFWICRIQLFTGFDSAYMFLSVYGGLGDFTHRVKVDLGSRS